MSDKLTRAEAAEQLDGCVHFIKPPSWGSGCHSRWESADRDDAVIAVINETSLSHVGGAGYGYMGEANRQTLDDDGCRTFLIHYTYSSVYAFSLNGCTQDLVDACIALSQYCVLDEGLWSEKELEGIQEQWQEWGRADFIAAVEQWHSVEHDGCESCLDDAYYQACSDGENYPECSGDEVHFHEEEIAKAMEPAALAALGLHDEDVTAVQLQLVTCDHKEKA